MNENDLSLLLDRAAHRLDIDTARLVAGGAERGRGLRRRRRLATGGAAVMAVAAVGVAGVVLPDLVRAGQEPPTVTVEDGVLEPAAATRLARAATDSVATAEEDLLAGPCTQDAIDRLDGALGPTETVSCSPDGGWVVEAEGKRWEMRLAEGGDELHLRPAE